MRTPPDGGVLMSEKLPLDYTHSSAAKRVVQAVEKQLFWPDAGPGQP